MDEHWSRLQKQYQQVTTLIDRIALRERALLLITLITAIYFLWEVLLMSPSRKAIKSARVEEAALIKQIKESQQKITRIEIQSPTTKLDKTLVTNSTVIPMLKSLLEKQQGIMLKGLYNLPNQPINDITLKLPLPLYKQKVHLVFNGNYLSTYEYLRSVEDLKWMIFWDELQYTVTKYPNAEINLTVYTLG